MPSTQLKIQSKEKVLRKRVERKLKFTQNHFQMMVEGVKDYAIFFMNDAGQVLYWNKGARHLIGYRDEEVIGKSFDRFFTLQDRKAKKPQNELKLALETGRAGDENWLVRKDKTKFWVSGFTTAVKDKRGKILYLAKIVHDVSAYKELEERKDDFISMASHELKTPVSSIQAFIQILQKRSEKLEDKFFNEILTKTGNQVTNLTLLIDDLLNVSKIHAGRLEMHQNVFDFDDLVREEVEHYQIVTKTHKIILKGETRKKVIGDKYRVGQVLLNFLTNATKYSPNAKSIVVKLYIDKGSVVCSVQDKGIGISKENQKRVFERFFRASGVDEKTFPGIGLGLYVSNEIVERHKGRIWLGSTKGKGSTFYFSLPVRA